jgi:hypothetical protein
MLERSAVPSDLKALSGNNCAVGATRWITPMTIVPWPKAAYCVLVSKMAAEDWSKIAALD